MKKIVLLSFFIVNLSFGQSITISSLELTRNGGQSNDIKINKYSDDYPTIFGRRAGGTQASPTNTTNGMELLRIGAGGFSNTLFSFSPSSNISFYSTEAWNSFSQQGTKMTFSTTSNGTNTPSERMVINHDGKIGIGLTIPNQILDINGRMRIRHTPGYTSGVWMSNSTNSLGDGDGAFYGMLNDNQTGIFIGNAWRFAFNSNGNAVITGFTQLGNDVPAGADASKTAPAIKTLKLTGTTASTQGGTASVAHGLSLSKILSYTVLVNATNGTSSLIMPEYTGDSALNYTTFCVSSGIFVVNTPSKSSGLLSKSFRVLITYEE